MPKVYGYLRVSTNKGQTTENQKIEILAANPNIDEWFSDDAVSGTVEAFSRPKFKEMVSKCKEGDSVIVVKIDRLGRSSVDTLQAIRKLQDEHKVSLVILQLGKMELTSPAGKMMLSMLTAVAEMERDLIVERVNAGLERAKQQGTELGPPLKVEPNILSNMIAERKSGIKLKDIAQRYNVHTSFVDRNVKRWEGRMDEYSNRYSVQQKQYSLKQQLV